jgi:hypothetical protein
MKNLKLLFVVAIAIALASCEDLLDKAKVTLHPGFDITQNIDIDSIITNVNVSATLNIAGDSIIDKYKDHIESLTITAVKITVLSYTGAADAKLNGTLGYSAPSGTVATTFATITDMDLQSLYNSGNSYNAVVDANEIKTLSSMFLNDKSAKIYVTASTTKTPVQAELQIHFDTEVVAKAIK